MFFSDEPILRSSEDRLRRQHYAETIAAGLLDASGSDSLVVGLLGDWGSGKSSILNMMVEAIEASPKAADFVIHRFNPWGFSGHPDLLGIYFRELATAIGRTAPGKIGIELGELIQAYAGLLHFVPAPGPIPTGLAKTAHWLGQKLKMRGDDLRGDVRSVKIQLEEALKKLNKKILVIIDDIDRLTDDEIREIFKLIKVVGNLPSTIYILAFDRVVVEKALSATQQGAGAEYLEKIVQLPFQVPSPGGEQVARELFAMLDAILDDLPSERFDRGRWQNLYHGGVRHLVKNIRDAKRYANAMAFSMSVMGDETNPVDLLGTEALRLHDPALYEAIASNKSVFSGSSDSGSGTVPGQNADRNIAESIIGSAPEHVQEICKQLFPRIEGLRGGANYGSSWEAGWRQELRVCSPDIFDRYFQLALPEGELGEAELKSVLDAAIDPASFVQTCRRFIADGRISRLLDRLQDYTADFDQAQIPSFFEGLVEIADDVPLDSGGISGMDNRVRLGRLNHQLLKRIPTQDERMNLLKDVLGRTSSIAAVVYRIQVLGQEQGKHGEGRPEPEQTWTVSATQLAELEELVVQRIRDAAQQSTLLRTPRERPGILPILNVLYVWKSLGKPDEPSAWLDSQLQSDENLVEFLKGCIFPASSWNMSDYYETRSWNININNIAEFVDVEALGGRARDIDQTDLADFSRLTLETFIRESEALRSSRSEDAGH